MTHGGLGVVDAHQAVNLAGPGQIRQATPNGGRMELARFIIGALIALTDMALMLLMYGLNGVSLGMWDAVGHGFVLAVALTLMFWKGAKGLIDLVLDHLPGLKKTEDRE